MASIPSLKFSTKVGRVEVNQSLLGWRELERIDSRKSRIQGRQKQTASTLRVIPVANFEN
jgi:hypothetical protein